MEIILFEMRNVTQIGGLSNDSWKQVTTKKEATRATVTGASKDGSKNSAAWVVVKDVIFTGFEMDCENQKLS